MAEQFCQVSPEITLCYETFGDPSDPTALLVMGLGTQMIAWHEDFCGELASRGLHVVRFDNRDCGRSTHIRGAPPPASRRRPAAAGAWAPPPPAHARPRSSAASAPAREDAGRAGSASGD